MPGINDDPQQVETILAAAAEAGATGIGGIGLHLRGEVRGIFLEWLRSYRPDLVERYEELYARGAYLAKDEQRRLTGLLRRPEAPRIGVRRLRGVEQPAAAAADPRPAAHAAVQESLF
jgi:DNA repair photolyase